MAKAPLQVLDAVDRAQAAVPEEGVDPVATVDEGAGARELRPDHRSTQVRVGHPRDVVVRGGVR